MKHHKIAYAVWLVFNFVAYAIFISCLRSIYATGNKTTIVSLPGNLYLYIFTTALYVYALAYLWNFLQEHIALSNEVNEREVKKNKGLLLLDELSSWILSQALLVCLVVPMWYWLARVFILVFDWLKNGEWVSYSSCEAIQLFCNVESSFIGINILSNWIGNTDFGLLLTSICFSLFFIFKKHPIFTK